MHSIVKKYYQDQIIKSNCCVELKMKLFEKLLTMSTVHYLNNSVVCFDGAHVDILHFINCIVEHIDKLFECEVCVMLAFNMKLLCINKEIILN